MTPQRHYHSRRDKDGCGDTLELKAPRQDGPFACIPFWNEPDTNKATETETLARRVVATLNAREGHQPRHGPVLTFRAPIRNREPNGEEEVVTEVVTFEAAFGFDDEECLYQTLKLPGEDDPAPSGM